MADERKKPSPVFDVDPLDLLGTDDANNKINDETRKKSERDRGDLLKVLSLPEGRRFIWKQLSQAGIFQDPFSTNAMQMSKNCGMKALGLNLLADVNEADVNIFAQIQREYISEIKSKENSK